jgi:glucokinase
VSAIHTLLADIGATNARFAVLAGDTTGPIEHVLVASYPSARDAISAFLRRSGAGRIDAAVFGVAGPARDGRCVVTNSHWVIDSGELSSAFTMGSVKVVNDFEAVAWGLPRLRRDDIALLRDGNAEPDAPMAVLGPGTGMGMAGLARYRNEFVVIATEGGHATLPGTTEREDAVIAHLRDRFGHASIERALSGSGLENLYAAMVAIDGRTVPHRNAEEITRRALDRSCATCCAAVDMFCAILGGVAGNVALTFRARGGVYIAGGIAPRLLSYLAKSEFAERFVAKGRFREYLESIPVAVITHPDAAFLGLASLAGAPPVS